MSRDSNVNIADDPLAGRNWLTLEEACAASGLRRERLLIAAAAGEVGARLPFSPPGEWKRFPPFLGLHVRLIPATNNFEWTLIMPAPGEPVFGRPVPPSDVQLCAGDVLRLRNSVGAQRRCKAESSGFAETRPLSPRLSRQRQMSVATKAASIALALYLREHEPKNGVGRNELARRVAEFAVTAGLEGADALDGEGSVLREMAAGVLQALRQRQQDR